MAEQITSSEAALREAEQLIAQAQASGATRLELRDLAIEALPPSLASLADQLLELALVACTELSDVSACAGLTQLQSLQIQYGLGDPLETGSKVVDLTPLSNLEKLQTLDLGWCGALTDVTGLQGLTGLQTLDLGWCGALTEVTGLQGLTGLQTLDLSYCGALTDVTGLQGLTGLQTLDLGWCGALTDVTVLQGLTGLQTLKVLDGPSVKIEQCLALDGPCDFPALNDLVANRITGAPSELASTHFRDNCLPRLQAWRDDLARGRAEHSELKLFVLGNGRVGKTQICRRLRGEAFDASVPSTHGIQLGEHRLELDDEGGPVTLRFWDFGGQDIYLGTHALFLDDRAIYLIVWSPEFENTDEVVDNGVVMRNRPLAYWLAYVHSLAGPQARVLVVQTRCDRAKDRREAPLPADHGFETLVQTSCSSNSAVNPGGMKRLLAELEDAVRAQIETYGRIPMPQSWADVGDSLRALRDEQVRRTIPRDEFDTLCRDQHGVGAPGVVLDYLHRGGQVFWNQGAFGGEIVLQLDWALDGLYAVLHRDHALPLIRERGGLFTPALLASTVWRDRPEDERNLLLSMMLQCQIAFKVVEGQYVAPAALPDEADVADRIERDWRGAEPGHVVTLRYGFLHEGVVRAMLCAIGEKAGVDAVYWRGGVCFYDRQARTVLRIRSALPEASGAGLASAGGTSAGHCGWIEVAAAGHGQGAAELVKSVVESIQQIRIGTAPEMELTFWPDTLTTYSDDDQPDSHTTSEPSWDDVASRDGAAPFEAIRPGPRPGRTSTEQRSAYVSYAWGGESEALVDAIEQRLVGSDIDFVRDKRKLRPGDWLSVFMAEIGRADIVLVVFSKKYLESRYCMLELLHLFQRSQGDKASFLAQVVPVVPPDLPLDSELDRLDYVDYWSRLDAAFDAKIKSVGELKLSPAGREEWLAIKDFAHRTPELLSWVADTLMPRGPYGLDAAVGLIRERAMRIK